MSVLQRLLRTLVVLGSSSVAVSAVLWHKQQVVLEDGGCSDPQGGSTL